MANEKTTRAPLTATVGERLGEKAQEGDTAGLDRAQAAVEELRSSGWEDRGAEAQAGERRAGGPPAGEAGREPQPPERRRATGRTSPRPQRSRAAARGSGVAWALAAGLGTFAVLGIVRRAFGR